MTALVQTLPPPFPRWKKGDRAHLIYHYPGDLGKMNDKMSSAEANMLLYSKPNSIRFMDELARAGINSCDNDVIKGPIIKNKQSLYVSHWQPIFEEWVGYRDKCGHYKPGSKVHLANIDPIHIPHCEHKFGGYHINSIETHIKEKIKRGQGCCFEAKTYIGEERLLELMHYILAQGGAPDQFMWMTLPTSNGVLTMRNAGHAGFKTGLLGGHGDSLFPAFRDQAKITWVKGAAGLYNPQRLQGKMVRIGTSASSATQYGCSVTIDRAPAARNKITLSGGIPTTWKKP